MLTDKTLLIYDPDTQDFYRETRSVRKVNPKGISNLYANSYRVFPGLSPDCFVAETSDRLLFIAHRLRQIPFLSEFTVGSDENDRTVYLPYLTQTEYGRVGVTSDDINLVFHPQDDQALWLLVNPSSNMGRLIAVHLPNGTYHHPGIPNVFQDGRLCTGDATLPQPDELWGGVDPYLNKWLAAWSSCKFNDDLFPPFAQEACKFNEHGVNIPVDAWQTKSPRLGLEEDQDRVLGLVLEHALKAENALAMRVNRD